MIISSSLRRRTVIRGAIALIAIAVLSACNSASNKSRRSTNSESGGAWTYPIHLGDARGKAHEFLGNAARTTEVLEEFPLSGVTLWFSPEGRVTKLNFQGGAGALYSIGQDWISSDRTVVFGLSARSTEAEFTTRLGAPASRD